ncbi:hypothetical protein ENBRE01_1851, partial [Enteropsectra breve]
MFVLYQTFLLAHSMLILTKDGIVNGVTTEKAYHITCCCDKEEREFKRLKELYGGILNPSNNQEGSLTQSKNRPFCEKLFSFGWDGSIRGSDEPIKQNLYSSLSNEMYIKCAFWKCPQIYHLKCLRANCKRYGSKYIFGKPCTCGNDTTINFKRFVKRHTDEYLMDETKQKHFFERIYMVSLLYEHYFCDLLKTMKYTLENTRRLIRRLEAEKNPNKTQLLVSARFYSTIIDPNTTAREVCKALAAQLKMSDPGKDPKFLSGRNFLSEKVKNEQLGPDEVKTLIFEIIRDSPHYFDCDSKALCKMLLEAYIAT